MGFLDYLALVLLLLTLTMVFYGFIFIHDIPYQVAIKRHHPHKEAIHVACWLSLFTLHAIWPIVYIWAIMGHKPWEVTLTNPSGNAPPDLQERLSTLEDRLRKLESSPSTTQKLGA